MTRREMTAKMNWKRRKAKPPQVPGMPCMSFILALGTFCAVCGGASTGCTDGRLTFIAAADKSQFPEPSNFYTATTLVVIKRRNFGDWQQNWEWVSVRLWESNNNNYDEKKSLFFFFLLLPIWVAILSTSKSIAWLVGQCAVTDSWHAYDVKSIALHLRVLPIYQYYKILFRTTAHSWWCGYSACGVWG